MFSNLINKIYEIKSLNALDLRNSIIEEYNLDKRHIVGFYTQAEHRFEAEKVFDDSEAKLPLVEKLGKDEIVRDAYSFVEKDSEIFNFSSCFLNPLYYSLEDCLNKIREEYNTGKCAVKRVAKIKDKNDKYNLFGDKVVCKRLSLEDAIELFSKKWKDYIDNYQYKISDEILKYQFDFSPVIVNVRRGKVELIDGFKRLLLTDPRQLNISVPVIHFYDLNDEDYLTILFAANAWKLRDGKKGSFYDRGFLFSLTNRFNFDVTKELPWKFVLTDVLSDYVGFDVSYHDFGVHDETGKGCFSYKNPVLVDDVNQIVELLGKTYYEDYDAIGDLQDYDFGRHLLKTFIQCVGIYRKKGNFEKLELGRILEDYLARHRKVIFKKINMSVPGYIENHFREQENRDFDFKI